MFFYISFQFTKADKISGNGSIAATTGGVPTGQSGLTGGGQVVGQVQQLQLQQPAMGGANVVSTPGTGPTQPMATNSNSSCNYGGDQLVSEMIVCTCMTILVTFILSLSLFLDLLSSPFFLVIPYIYTMSCNSYTYSNYYPIQLNLKTFNYCVLYLYLL